MRRREFMGLMAMSATLVVPGPKKTGEAAPDVIVFDARYPDARRFAKTLERRGAVAVPTSGELVTVWRANGTVLTNPGIRIAALVQHSDFELLKDLARPNGLRVLQQARVTLRGRAGTGMRRGALTSGLLG